MEVVKGKIVDITENGVVITAPLQSIETALKRKYDQVEIGFPDGRYITLEQRKKAYALMNEIAEYTGDDLESNKQMLKLMFLQDNITSLYKQIFSLSNCDRTTAREFITFLIDFIIRHEIPTKQPLLTMCEDVTRYEYMCLKHKKCAICGKGGELHHIDAIGMGNNRHTIFQLGMRVMCLCRLHHTESHNKGQQQFLQDYHLEGVKMNKELGKIYKLTKKNLGEDK